MNSSLEINDILREFHKVSGFRISIHDTEFNEIYAYPEKLSPYCAKIQTNPHNRKACIRNDRIAFQKVKNTGELTVYRCSHGLYEAVAPIYHYGILSGFLMMGQVCDNKEKHFNLLKSSLKGVVNGEEESEKIFDSIKDVPQ